MRKKAIVLLLAASLAASCNPVLASESAAETETESEDSLTPLTSGDFYDDVQEINPDIEISVSDDNEVHITYDVNDSVDKSTVSDFFWQAVQILQLPDMGTTYSDINFTLLGDGCFEYFRISDYVSIYNFSSTFLTSFSTDETPKSYFTSYYYAIFGAHDTSNILQKDLYDLGQEYGIGDYELPDTYRNGYLWIFVNFDSIGELCGFTVNDSAISIELLRSDSEDQGETTKQYVYSALNNFIVFCNADPDSMPYEKLQIVCTDISDRDRTLWNYTMEYLNDSWVTTTNEGRGDFLAGLNSN